MEQWHLVYTKRHQETPVNHLLQQKGWETFLPGMEIERGYGRGKRLDPFFPQYIFLRVDLASAQALQIPYMTGVSKIVAFGSIPIVVAEEVVDNIRSRYEEYVRHQTGDDASGDGSIHATSGAGVTEIDSLFESELTGAQRSELLLYLLAR